MEIDGLDEVLTTVAHVWSIAALLLRKTRCSFVPRGFSTNRIHWIQLSFVKKSSILSNVGSVLGHNGDSVGLWIENGDSEQGRSHWACACNVAGGG